MLHSEARKVTGKKILLITSLALGIYLLTTGSSQKDPRQHFHSWEELMAYRGGDPIDLPENSNSLFTGSGKCSGCHGFDPNGLASITEGGIDVNVSDDWRATMMANSAKDPFWRAKVSHEVAVNPEHQQILEDKCTSCHAPLGRFAAHHDGAEFYSIADMVQDTLALDGVSCNACHQQRPEGLGDFFSGELFFETDTLYGPYGGSPEEPPIFESPMLSFVGYAPVYGESISKSENCAGCHSLITETVDLDGNLTGGSFVEQATYHEWENSSYSDPDTGQECQGCHFPRIDSSIIISSNYAFLEGREPFGLHYMVGGNSFMLELMRNYGDQLGVTADSAQFNTVIDRTLTNLQTASADLVLEDMGPANDTAYYEVSITNLTGHKFPSGYPARRAFVEFVAIDDAGDTLFQSGVMQSNYEVAGQNEEYEPHYDYINAEDQVQIYEMVMGDVNGDVTTVLERADEPIKDNRLVPLGFSTSHIVYDTTLMAGAVLNDPNFNYQFGDEGSGSDVVEYRVPLMGYEGTLEIHASLHYQSAPPKWNQELFSVSTPEIEAFEEMYWETGPDAVLVDSDQVETLIVGVGETAMRVTMYPNPTAGDLQISINKENTSVRIYDATGKLVDQLFISGRTTISMPEASGIYHVVVGEGIEAISKQVIKL
jgi:hypothetical protein